jgi:hypothetical protein
VLFFEFFPAALAIVSLIVGIALYAINQRARNNPHDQESPRSPSKPPISPEQAAAEEASPNVRRPSMRA